MDVRTAIGVEYKRRAAEDEVERALHVAIKAEADDVRNGIKKPTALERFQALGKRVIASADNKGARLPYGSYADKHHEGFTNIGLEGLAIVTKARERCFSSMDYRLHYIEIDWRSSAFAADTPIATQAVALLEVRPDRVTPEVTGMLRLMEQSMDVAELARKGTPIA